MIYLTLGSILHLDFELQFQPDFMNFYFWKGGSKGPAELSGPAKLSRFLVTFGTPWEEKQIQERKKFPRT